MLNPAQYICPGCGLHMKLTPLTKAEISIIRDMWNGLNCHQIAHKRCISVKTYETHRRNVLHKAGVKTLASLFQWAIHEGIIPMPMVTNQ